MQVELKALQRQLGITFVFVTHDQEEALSMSDRLIVFNQGRIEQVGTPEEIYEHPASAFVANFVGTSNMLAGAVAERFTGSTRAFAIRPEKIRLNSGEAGERLLTADGEVTDVQYHGANTRYVVRAEDTELVVMRQNAHSTRDADAVRAGDRVTVGWMCEDMHYLGDGTQ